MEESLGVVVDGAALRAAQITSKEVRRYPLMERKRMRSAGNSMTIPYLQFSSWPTSPTRGSKLVVDGAALRAAQITSKEVRRYPLMERKRMRSAIKFLINKTYKILFIKKIFKK